MNRRLPRPRSLKNKLALVFFAINTLAVAAIWFYVVPQLQTSLEKQKLRDLGRVAPATSAPLREAEGREISAKNLDELVRAVADGSDARVTLLGVQRSRRTDPRTLYVISDSRTQQAVEQSFDLAQRALRTHRIHSGYDTSTGERVVQAAVPLIYRGRADWIALYSRPLTGVAETVDLIRRELLVAGLGAGGLALMGAYLVAGMVGRRVRRLERAAGRVAAGQFIEPLPVDSSDELGQLTEAFNDMQIRLSRVDRARKDFVANASHELRTPLFSLGGFIELLEDEDLDEASRSELLSAMHGQVDRLQKLAVDLLDLSRLDAGSFELERDRADLAEIARLVVGEFAPAVRRGEADLQLRVPEGAVEVTCDRERVAQIMRILVDNAIRHTPRGAPITVSASHRNGSARFTVADTGPGMDDAAVSQVFDRFFTGDAGNGGAGLGLAIAKELAERMDGEIRVKSRPGRTAFTFELAAEDGG